MDLNELKKHIETEMKKNIELQNEKKELESSIKKTVYKNIKTFLEPAIEEMNSFVKLVHDETHICFNYGDNDYPLTLGLDVPDYISLRISVNSWGINVLMGKHTDYSWDRDISHPDSKYSKDDVFNYGYHLYLSYWFSTKEKTLELVEICKEYYLKLLDHIISKLRDENNSLSTSIELLRETYAKSSCVEHNEDGTVEIHLGGKTYKATLKED